ncbi:MAG TPA: cupredoxin domain-containing protein [Blastocatellia bacterium]|nr:cupredoxin domain-containing protein [Blastocatellia bacterium]
MKRILALILIALAEVALVAASLFLTGCGANNTEQKPASASAPSTTNSSSTANNSSPSAADTKASQNAASVKETVIRLTAKRFEYSPSQITVKKGTPVVIELISKDRLHGFNLPDFKIRSDAKPNEVTRVRFVPDKTGTFTFACDVYCGDGHEDMTGTLVVTD